MTIGVEVMTVNADKSVAGGGGGRGRRRPLEAWRRALSSAFGLGRRAGGGAARRRRRLSPVAARFALGAGLLLCLVGVTAIYWGATVRTPLGAAASESAAGAAAGAAASGPAASGGTVAGEATPSTAGSAAAAAATAPRLSDLRWPVAGGPLLGFGWHYSAAFGDWRFHPGTDLATAPGTSVRAALPGRVASVEETSGMRWVVTLDNGRGVCTVYAGLGAAAVEVGTLVAAGETLGQTGELPAAEANLGPHLHFELRVNGEAADAARYAR